LQKAIFVCANVKSLHAEISDNDKKNFRQVVSKITKRYFAGQYQDSVSVFSVLQSELQEGTFGPQEAGQLKKMMAVFFLGQLVGLPTLHSILRKHGVKSNNRQISYRALCKKMSINVIRRVFESMFEAQIFGALKKLGEKDNTCWSRELVTALLDDSIFKQWLGSQDQRTAFTYRFRAFYCSQDREVTLLAFRLNGSKKVSIIYTPDKQIFAKTLRRHWFQRTLYNDPDLHSLLQTILQTKP